MTTDWYAGGWIQTFTGRKFFPLAPRAEDVLIEDIAHALSNICRYGGHCREFYSVAQHCCMVADHMPEFHLEGLMHDAAEAYLGDMVRPVKHDPSMRGFRVAEAKLEEIIVNVFDLDGSSEVQALIKEHDNRALFTERKFLLDHQSEEWTLKAEPFPIAYLVAWDSEYAEHQFLNRFYKLNKARYARVNY